jgi:hypothetical protein
MPFPSTLNTLDRSQDIKHLKPYVEAGIGIENILNLFVWMHLEVVLFKQSQYI